MKPIEFTKEMKILSISYNKDFTEETIVLWYEQFKNINKDILHKSIQKLITTNKYMPSIAEILEICKQEEKNMKITILEIMKNNNYFKSLQEYDKTIKFVEKDIIPNWLLEDMRKYYSTKLLDNKKLIGE